MAAFSDVKNDPFAERAVKPWRVLHACETVSTTAALAEAETSVGMTPRVLSREMWKPDASENHLSLLTAWHDVRDWRHALNEAETMASYHIVHAHSFASAMAGVRGSIPLVYDFEDTLEEVGEQSHPGAWLLRSLRVAEQFALSRASAVVVHSEGMKNLSHERGAASNNIFVVADPCTIADLVVHPDWAMARGIDLGCDTIVFALADPAGFESTLRVFGALAAELEQTVFVFECDDPDRDKLLGLARELDIADSIRCVPTAEREKSLACADVVIAPPTQDRGGRNNPGMLVAMAAAKAVVAADVPENRECSPEGRGCIWYRACDTGDLIQRASFVARNQDFARGLGAAARDHLLATRRPEVIGRAYDEIYRFAQNRRNDNVPRIPAPKIYALGPT